MTPIERLAPHKDAIFFNKAFGQWPGGDWMELKRIAIDMGFPAEDIRISCDDCRQRVLDMFFDKLIEANPNEYTEYKQRKQIL